jgi:formylglycine-generating enzyme required for sulfatase activity/tRNA A-37 threonylcarbamoyl transferase component Bud32
VVAWRVTHVTQHRGREAAPAAAQAGIGYHRRLSGPAEPASPGIDHALPRSTLSASALILPIAVNDQSISIPGYTIIRELGRGGMATVYLAEQDCLGRQVALKVMQPPTMAGYDFTARFIREGQIIARLQHPRIVTIYDLNVAGGMLYFSMEYLPDGTLSDLILAGIPTSRVLRIMRQVAEALAFAHAQGIIHRDIKPQNILIRTDGSPVLTDFGIARAATTDEEATQLTRVGMVVGSPRYMSPEQAMSQPVDRRSDLYSLGIVFYQALAKEVPYKGTDIVTLGVKHCTEPIPLLEGDLRRFQPVIERLLAKAPDDRYTDADELVEDIRALEAASEPTQVVRKFGPRWRSHQGLASTADRRRAGSGRTVRRWFGSGAVAAMALSIAAGLYWAAPVQRSAEPSSSDVVGDEGAGDDDSKPERPIEAGRTTKPDVAGLTVLDVGDNAPIRQNDTRQALIRQAKSLVAEGLVDEAAATIRRGLESAPGDAEFLTLQRALREERMAAQVGRPVDADELTVAGQSGEGPRNLDQVSGDFPNHPDPDGLRDQLPGVRAAREALLAQLDECRERFPPGSDLVDAYEAAACWRSLLGHDQTRDAAIAAVAAIETDLQARVDAALAKLDRDAATTALAAFSSEHDDLTVLLRRLSLVEALSSDLVLLSSGCFRMGSPDDEAGREPDEQVHRACVDRFEIGRFEVTVDDFRRFVDATDYVTDAERGVGDVDGCWAFDQENGGGWAYQAWASWREPNKDRPSDGREPASCVSWNDALAYTEWLNAETGLKFRLPTEEEWEYAARAGVAGARFWGDGVDEAACSHASIADTGHGWSDGFPCDDRHEWAAPVGSFAANPWSLHDMLGNVWEWTCSEYQQVYAGSQEACAKPSSRAPRVLRGGAWNSGPPVLRAAYRNRNFPESRYSFVGFRLVRDPIGSEVLPDAEGVSGGEGDDERTAATSRSAP